MFDFQKLEVYKKAKNFHMECKRLLSGKKTASYLNNQIGRASLSVALNIAEGSGKFSKADRRNFFVISRGSVFECVAVLDILKDQQIISESEFVAIVELADELSRILYAMIKNLGKTE